MAITTKEITFENEIEYSLIENGGYICTVIFFSIFNCTLT